MNMAVLDYHHQEKWPNGFGQLQSPINLLPATPADPSTLKIETPWRVTQEIDDQVTIRLTGTGRTRIDQDQWQLMQAHIHVPAEHQITNQHAAELHFVHQSAIGAFALLRFSCRWVLTMLCSSKYWIILPPIQPNPLPSAWISSFRNKGRYIAILAP